ncbi:MAG: threonylcarbamoyl-AMP synthase [Acidobacteria bacterium]|nr:threonylcarbamoyl-AMP synthase [Acidobacteriota bacterium]
MDLIRINPDALESAAIARAAAALAAGGIVAYPTDTFYGLAVDPRNLDAVRKLFDAKGRAAGQASPLIAATVAQAEQAVEFHDAARRLATQFWPGPLSLVLRAHALICREALGGGDTAAVRVPDHAIARALAAAASFCITATSANLSTAPPARSADEISPRLVAHIDVLIDGGPAPGVAPSTIVDLTDPVPRLVRAGGIAWERVLESLQ